MKILFVGQIQKFKELNMKYLLCVCGWDYYTLYSKFLNLEPHEIVTLNNNTKKSFLFCEAVEFKFFM